MNLNDAINHCEEKAKELREQAGFDTDNERYRMSESEKTDCIECANEHEQLAEWLKELKTLRKALMLACEEQYWRTSTESLMDDYINEARAELRKAGE